MSAWSFSRIKAFQTCPLQYLEVKVLKHYQETQHPTTVYGLRGHGALEHRVDSGTVLPSEFAYLEPFAQGLLDMPGHTFCELELACTKDKLPAGFHSEEAWCRGIIDVLKFQDTTAVAMDYKFGKVRPTSQLKLMALLVFANYPTVQTVKTRFLWIQFRDKTDGVYHRKDVDQMWEEFEADAAQLELAHETGDFQPRPSGLCKAHCVVSSCSYYQRGNRR